MAVGTVVFLSACRSDPSLTYAIDFSAYPDERASIESSFLEWERVTGVSASEVDHPDRAMIVFQLAELEGNIVGETTFSTESEFQPETLSSTTVLRGALILSAPEVWERDEDGRLRHLNHEIGHVLTAAGHTTPCPSTMHANSDTCGTEEIDADAAFRARARIGDGWLSRVGGFVVR